MDNFGTLTTDTPTSLAMPFIVAGIFVGILCHHHRR